MPQPPDHPHTRVSSHTQQGEPRETAPGTALERAESCTCLRNVCGAILKERSGLELPNFLRAGGSFHRVEVCGVFYLGFFVFLSVFCFLFIPGER